MENKEKELKNKETTRPVEEAGEKQAHHHPLKKELEEDVAGLESEVKELREELQATEGKAREYLDDLQRLKAEFDNYRKRMIREQTAVIESANQDMAGKLLPVIDNLERAIAAGSSEPREGVTDGVKMVYSQLMDILKAEGLEEIDPRGHPFDPRECEAIMAVLSDDHEDNTVIEVHQKGYKWKDRLLRPAMATVSKCASEDGENK